MARGMGLPMAPLSWGVKAVPPPSTGGRPWPGPVPISQNGHKRPKPVGEPVKPKEPKKPKTLKRKVFKPKKRKKDKLGVEYLDRVFDLRPLKPKLSLKDRESMFGHPEDRDGGTGF